MNNDQITALAREYAEECAEEVGVMFNPQNWACSKCEIEAKAVIIWLLRRFYLVEKNAVRKEFHEIKLALGDGGRSEWEDDINMEKEVLLKSLFPEIGKEVQNEKGSG